MKILIITMNVGKTAPGIVFERLIQGLSSLHQIDVLTADYSPSLDLTKTSDTIISKWSHKHTRLKKLLILLFNVNPYDCYWARKSIKLLKTHRSNKYDIILSFLSYQHYAALIAGTYLSKKSKSRHAVYTVDAIPAPNGWLENDSYYKSLKKMMAKYLQNVDILCSANYQMLNYQLSTFRPKENLITDVLYNPGSIEIKEFPNPRITTNYFVYTGGIYGVRRVVYILKGFEKLLERYPDSKFLFIGSELSPDSLSRLKPETLKKINLVPFTRDLDPYYSCATALIDIDADIENDVFLSSKMSNYIMINRIIISETGSNSPSRNLFKEIDSIIQCDHDPDQLCEAMSKSIEFKHTFDFDDRKTIIKLFDLENIVNRLNKLLSQ
jgi:glycosyltransferase involved in cell wall biosynthesis